MSTGAENYSACSSPKSYSSLTVGTYTFKVKATDPAGNSDLTPATRSFVVVNAATKLAFTTSPQTIAAGDPTGTITVQIQDSSSNPINATTDTTVFLSTTSAGGVFRNTADSDTITQVTIPTGSNSASFRYRDTKAGSWTIKAADQSGATDTGLTDATQAVTVNPGTATKLVVTSGETDLISGATRTLTAEIRDANDNLVDDDTTVVTFAKTAGSGTVTGLGTATASNGTAPLTVTGQTAGSITIGATATGLTTDTTTFTVVHGAADHIDVSSDTSDLTSGGTRQLTATIEDAAGNTVTSGSDSSLSVTFAKNSGVGTVTGLGSSTASAGVATLTATGELAGSITLSGSSGTVTAGATTTFTVVHGAAVKIDLTGSTTDLASGATRPLTATIQDAAGNTVTADDTTVVTFSQSAGTGSVTGTGTATVTDGVATKTVTAAAAGSVTIEATATGLTADTLSFTVVAGTAASLTLSGAPASVTAGDQFSLTATATDAFGNTATGYTGTVAFTSNDAQATTPANYTFLAGDNGTKTFTNGFALKTAGSRTVTVTDTGSGSLTDTIAGITVGPAAASTLAVVAPSNATTGIAFNFTVTAKDPYGNTATGYTGTVAFTSSAASKVLPADYTFVAGDNGTKQLSATINSTGSHTITATDTVTSSITGTSNSINVSPEIDHFAVTTSTTTPTAGTAFSVTVTAEDAFNNTVTGYTGEIDFSLLNSDAGATVPASYTFVASDNGSKTFTDGVTLTKAQDNSIVVTDDRGTPELVDDKTGQSAVLTVGHAAVSKLALVAPAGAVSGTAFNFTVVAQDDFGNTATGYIGIVGFTSSDGAATLPANYTFLGTDAGTKELSATLNTLGSQTITATDTVTASITGTSNAIDVQSTPPAVDSGTTTITANPTSITADGTSTSSITVQAKDSGGNDLTSSAGTVVLLTDAGSLSAVTDNGDGTYGATLTSSSSVETATITGTIDGNPIADNASVDFVSGAAPPTQEPTADSASVATFENVPTSVTLTGSDPQGDPLTLRVTSLPSDGKLYDGSSTSDPEITSVPATITGTQVTYEPNNGFVGSDTFEFIANDGTNDSAPATITVQVVRFVPQPPAAPQQLSVSPQSPANFNEPRISGTSAVGTVRIYAGNHCFGEQVAVGPWNEFNNGGLAVSVLDDTTTDFYATVTSWDTGLTSTCSFESVRYVEDSTAPSPSAPQLATSSDHGFSDSDNITNDTAALFTGMSEPGSMVTVMLDDRIVAFALADSITGLYQFHAPGLNDGSHDFMVRATDIAGNTGVDTDRTTVTIDTESPEVSLSWNSRFISPNGDGKRERLKIKSDVNERVEWNLEVTPALIETDAQLLRGLAGNTFIPLQVPADDAIFAASGRSKRSMLAVWDGVDSEGTAVDEALYEWNLGIMDKAGNTVDPVSKRVTVDRTAPVVKSLQVAPNPFYPKHDHKARVRFELTEAGHVKVRIRRLGERRRVLNVTVRLSTPGKIRVAWDGKDRKGRPVAPGRYMVIVRAVDKAKNLVWNRSGRILVRR